MLDDESLKELAEDLAANGMLDLVGLSPEGALLDGLNRLRACEMAGVEPGFAVHEGEPVALIVSANAAPPADDAGSGCDGHGDRPGGAGPAPERQVERGNPRYRPRGRYPVHPASPTAPVWF